MNIGIIGFGGMGAWHARQLKTVDNADIVAVYDIDEAKNKAANEQDYRTHTSYDDFINDKEIQLVIIATPNNFHREMSIDCLMAGKNVICEKPAMMNARDLEEVIDVARKCNKVFSVHQNRRWDRDFNIVKKSLSENLIGNPFYIESRVQGSKGIPGDWRCEKIAGGGMIFDWGVHLIDQVMWLVDSPVTEIYAHILNVKFDVDDNFKLLLKFKNGISALVEVDTYVFCNLPRWHISGDAGTLVIKDWDCNGSITKANLVELKWDQGIVYTSAGPTKTMAPRPVETLEEIELPSVTVDCCDYYRNVIDVIEGNSELIVTPEQSLRVMKVIDAAFYSSENGVCVKGEF
jgi:scyllo-inositol 2-dehydrogenase (NADP+)